MYVHKSEFSASNKSLSSSSSFRTNGAKKRKGGNTGMHVQGEWECAIGEKRWTGETIVWRRARNAHGEKRVRERGPIGFGWSIGSSPSNFRWRTIESNKEKRRRILLRTFFLFSHSSSIQVLITDQKVCSPPICATNDVHGRGFCLCVCVLKCSVEKGVRIRGELTIITNFSLSDYPQWGCVGFLPSWMKCATYKMYACGGHLWMFEIGVWCRGC